MISLFLKYAIERETLWHDAGKLATWLYSRWERES
jgi:hypothetical protein